MDSLGVDGVCALEGGRIDDKERTRDLLDGVDVVAVVDEGLSVVADGLLVMVSSNIV